MSAMTTDDPRRLLHTAARWMTAVGWCYVPFGLAVVLFVRGTWQVALTGGCLLAGGAAFLVCGGFARQHRGWAVRLGIATAAVTGVGLALLLTLFIMAVGWHDLVRVRSVPLAAAALLLLVFVFVHAMIVWYLANSFDAIGAPAVMESGFEPSFPTKPRPVLPLGPNDGPPPAR